MFISISNQGKSMSLHRVKVFGKLFYLNLKLIHTWTKSNAQVGTIVLP